MPILDWLNKKEALTTADNTPYKVLVENKDLSVGDQTQGNMLIKGDNLEALKALLPYYKGRVKCIYIDPPYNTGSAFDHYDDNLEHSTWLSMMYPRLELLHELLAEDGVLFVNLDEIEHAYCKVVCDEIFGRRNYIGDLIWQKRKGGGNDSRFFAIDHDYILVYAKNSSKKIHASKWIVSQSDSYRKRYKEQTAEGKRFYWDTLARDGLQNPIPVHITCPDGSILHINSQQSQETIEQGLKTGDVRLTRTKKGWTLHHRVYMPQGQVLRSILSDVGTNKSAGDESELIFGTQDCFNYPKPETLIQKLLELVSKPGDLVLDSFLGSGTTAAVAQKMGRKYIGIEMGEHAITHCVPRMKKVIDGTDQGGISKALGWTGGGGFTFYDLGQPIFDTTGNINQGISFKDLAFHVWFSETKTPMQSYQYSPLLGEHQGTAFYLLYNGVLGDKRVNGGNVLTSKILEGLPPFDGPKVIYGESCRLSPQRLKKENIVFKQTPYAIPAR